MANHQITVQTADRKQGATFNPVSLTANPGDKITFVSVHKGQTAPQSITIAITSGNICSATESGKKQDSVVLPGNKSASVSMCSNAQPGGVTYKLAAISSSAQSGFSMGATTNATMTGDPEPVMDDDD
ncbi:MAG: hypothetical protein DWQ05_17825 [Calditrichaeota bacterium]|nr:MAG: hypothetical protein DWQ05_17825 [Calditrichota bacterium]